MLDRYLLRYFLAVVDCGTFSRAAQQCSVSQPTLSAGIAKLERLLDRKVFERSSQRVHLTDAGSRLLLHARRIESEFNQADAAVRGSAAARALRLGVLTTVATRRVARLVREARTSFPDMRLELVEGGERALLQMLARGRIDAALGLARNADRFCTEPFWEEGYRLALPAGHVLAGEASVPAEALAGEVMIVRSQCEALSETSRHFTERGVRPFFSLRSANDDRALALVAAGLGITVVPESCTAAGVVTPALAGFALRRTVGLLWRDESESLLRSLAPMFDPLRRQES